MALNLKNPEVERLATELALLTGETKTEAIRKALVERLDRLRAGVGRRDGANGLEAFLRKSVWPFVPASKLGKGMTRVDEDEILGFGGDGF